MGNEIIVKGNFGVVTWIIPWEIINDVLHNFGTGELGESEEKDIETAEYVRQQIHKILEVFFELISVTLTRKEKLVMVSNIISHMEQASRDCIEIQKTSG